jgi:hypothetical protein
VSLRSPALRLLRLPLLLLGGGALCWSWLAMPELRTSAGFTTMSSRILAGEPFRQDELERQVAAFAATPASAVPYARMQGAGPILQSRALEMAMDRADPAGLDARMATLAATLREALRFSPSDASLWTFLYWVETMSGGNSDRTLGYLALSYALSPFEGTVALRRNRFALAGFDRFDGATQDKVVSEFAGMLDARLMDAVFGNLAGPGWLKRDRLVAGVGEVDLAAKQELIKMFGIEGVRLTIPGMPETEERPWRK